MNEYLELNFYNTDDVDKNVEFENRRRSSVISDDAPYNCALVRFSVDSHNIPVFIPHIKEPRKDIFLKPNPPAVSASQRFTKTFASNINGGGATVKFTNPIPSQYATDGITPSNFYSTNITPDLNNFVGFGYGYFVQTGVRLIEHNNENAIIDIPIGHPSLSTFDTNGDGTSIHVLISDNSSLTPLTLYRAEIMFEFYNSPIALGSTNFVGYSITSFSFPLNEGTNALISNTTMTIDGSPLEIRAWNYSDNGQKQNYAKSRYNNNAVEVVLSYNFKTNGNHEFAWTSTVNEHKYLASKYQDRYIGFDTIPTLSDYNNFMNNNTSISQTFKEIETHELNTDLQVALEYSPNNDGVYYWSGEYVRWQPENNFLSKPPAPYSRLSVCSNPYFHAHSLKHISKLISGSLTRLFNYFGGNSWSSFTSQFSGKEVEIEEVDTKLGMLIPWEVFGNPKWRIVINGKMKRYFGFHTVPHERWEDAHVLVFDLGTIPKTALGYGSGGNAIQYGVIMEQFRSSAMFPFRSIVFKAIDFPINNLKRYTNSLFSTTNQQDTENMNELIVTDLLLNVQDLNNFYDRLTYTPQAYDRKISMLANDFSNIRIKVILETIDGVHVPLTCPHNGSATIMLQFTPA